jgi:hypothetical protein
MTIDIAADVGSQFAARLNGLESAVHEDDSN